MRLPGRSWNKERTNVEPDTLTGKAVRADRTVRLSNQEVRALRFQIGTSSAAHGGRRYLPFAFTEQGIAMLSTCARCSRRTRRCGRNSSNWSASSRAMTMRSWPVQDPSRADEPAADTRGRVHRGSESQPETAVSGRDARPHLERHSTSNSRATRSCCCCPSTARKSATRRTSRGSRSRSRTAINCSSSSYRASLPPKPG